LILPRAFSQLGPPLLIFIDITDPLSSLAIFTLRFASGPAIPLDISLKITSHMPAPVPARCAARAVLPPPACHFQIAETSLLPPLLIRRFHYYHFITPLFISPPYY
jgi:hypothetical protein